MLPSPSSCSTYMFRKHCSAPRVIVSLSVFGLQDAVESMREVVFFSQILIPFIILAYCTVRIVNRLRRKTIGVRTKLRRAVFLVTIVMVVFSLCFLPCTVARMVLLIVRLHSPEVVQENAAMVFDGLMVLSYIDCLLDPLVYCFCSTKFKTLYLSTYCSCFLKRCSMQINSSMRNPTQPARNKVI